MDPLTHALCGGALAAVVARRAELRPAVVMGMLAGVAPDLDILIQSESDPLRYLEYHRQFTHALLFVPVGAGIWTCLGYPFFRKWLGFHRLYLFAVLGFLHHGLLDAATSYGTHLMWPFSDVRTAWNIIAVIDPLFTLPILFLLVFAWVSRRSRWLVFALAWGMLYLGLGIIQRDRAEAAAAMVAAERGHDPVRLSAKPSIFNNVLFRTLYEYDDRYYVDAVRVSWRGDAAYFSGESAPVFSVEDAFPELDPQSVLAKDIERFRFFSDGWIYRVPGEPELVADLRYAIVPTEVDPLWAIRVDTDHPDRHVPYEVHRQVDRGKRDRFFDMLLRRTEPTQLSGR